MVPEELLMISSYFPTSCANKHSNDFCLQEYTVRKDSLGLIFQICKSNDPLKTLALPIAEQYQKNGLFLYQNTFRSGLRDLTSADVLN